MSKEKVLTYPNKLKFSLGDIVYLKTDIEQLERMVISINITLGGHYYKLISGINESEHYEHEIIGAKDILKNLGINVNN
jgi:hypothetical protein